jgi:hypothetical protein
MNLRTRLKICLIPMGSIYVCDMPLRAVAMAINHRMHQSRDWCASRRWRVAIRDLVILVVGLAAARGPLVGAEICGVEDDASGLVARRFFCVARWDEPSGELWVLYTVPC